MSYRLSHDHYDNTISEHIKLLSQLKSVISSQQYTYLNELWNSIRFHLTEEEMNFSKSPGNQICRMSISIYTINLLISFIEKTNIQSRNFDNIVKNIYYMLKHHFMTEELLIYQTSTIQKQQ